MADNKINGSAAELATALSLCDTRGNSYPRYRQLYRSIVKTDATKVRRAASCGMFLATTEDTPVWSKLITDEIVVYHAGMSLQQLLILPDGTLEERIVGADILSGEIPQSVIPFGSWRLQRLLDDTAADGFGLFGSIVVPGFDAADYQEKSTAEIIKMFPDLQLALQEYNLPV